MKMVLEKMLKLPTGKSVRSSLMVSKRRKS